MNNSKFINTSNISYLILFVSFLTFFYHLANIQKITFDEFHYVPAARQWLNMAPVTNKEHPPLGKYLIASGINMFGDNAVGWRAASAISGAVAILFCFLISFLIFDDLLLASSVSMFSLFNFWFYVQSRIGMLDIFMVTFFLGGIYYFLKYKYDPEDKNKTVSFYFSAIFWGLAVGIKWSAVFIYLPFFILSALSDLSKNFDKQLVKKVCLKYILFGLLSILVYFLTFIPYMFVTTGMRVSFFDIILKLPFEMLKMQESVPNNHSYGSSWYTWPLMIRPIWYEFIQVADKDYFQGVVLLGNPFQMLLGLLAFFLLIVRWGKNLVLTNFTLVLFLCSWLFWGIAPRKLSFFYYFFPSAIFYSFLVPMALREVFEKKKATNIMIGLTFISFLFFAYFFPILSGELALHSTKNKWMWLQSWI